MSKKEKRCYDGYLIKNLDPVVFLMPYVMPRRCDSETKVDLSIDIGKMEHFIKEHKQDIPGLTLYHAVFASIVRAAAVTPEINRFITGGRIYQRRTVRISMMVKKDLEVNGRESPSIRSSRRPTRWPRSSGRQIRSWMRLWIN